MPEHQEEDLNIKIKDILYKSKLSFDETRAFFDGIQYLEDEDKQQFLEVLEEDPELIYPLYINFKAKLAILEEDDTGRSWEQIVDDEVAKLDKYLSENNLKEKV